MQTFLPYTDFTQSAQCLDNRRCLKQAIEAATLIHIIRDPAIKGYQNHPITNMWRPYLAALIYYYNIVWMENAIRGVKWKKLHYQVLPLECPIEMPWWLNERLIVSHRSNLIRKFPQHYRKLWPDTPKNLPYWWPTTHLGE